MKSLTVATIRKTQKGSILVLNKGVEIFYNGEKVNIDETYKTLSLFNSEESAKGLLNKGIIDGELLNKKLEYINDKNITRDVVAFPVK